MDPDIKFTDEACEMLVKVPRPFLKLVLKGCVDWAKENNVTLITEKEMQIINDKRSKEKNKQCYNISEANQNGTIKNENNANMQ